MENLSPIPYPKNRMRFASALRLLALSIRARAARHTATVAAMAIGMLALGLSVAFGLGFGRSMRSHLAEMFPAQRVVLRPKALSLIWLQVETARLTPETLESVRALPGVARVSPEATIRFPISATGQLVGNEYRTDITVTGVEPWLLGDEAPASFAYDPAAGGVVPAVLSHYFLDLYNMTLAESNNLPKLTPSAAVGRNLELILGESTLRPYREGVGRRPRIAPSQIVGLTRNPDLLGLAIPLSAVEEFNRWYGLDEKLYRALHIELESPESLEPIREQIAALGLEISDRAAPWRRGVVVVRLVGWAVVGLGGLIFALALIYMGSSVRWMLLERRRELALLRALGAASAQIAGLVGAEIALTGALGIGAGTAAAWGILEFINAWYERLQANFSFLPSNLLSVPWTWLAWLALACWVAAVALALRRVLAASRVNIVATLGRED